MKHIQDTKFLLGLAMFVLGGILLMSMNILYISVIGEILAYLLVLAGLGLAVYRWIKRVDRVGVLFITGAGGLAVAVGLHAVMRFAYLPLLMNSTWYLICTGCLALMVYSQLKPEKDIDLRTVTNIRKNRNTWQLIQSIVLLVLACLLLIQRDALGIASILGAVILVYGIYRLVKSLTKADIREDTAYKEKDEELGAEIRRLQRIRYTLRIVMGIGLAATTILMIVAACGSSFIPCIIVGLLSSIVAGIQETYDSKIKKYVAENITREALEEVFDITEYAPFGSIAHGKITGANFGIGSFDRVHGSDYVNGFYKGLPIEMCDMTLTERRTRTDEHGRTEEYDATVFKGFWLICDFGKELSAELRLWERDRLGKLMGGKGISTDNEAFNKHFHIESEIEEEAFYILTPHMMEYILDMDKKANGQTHLRFDRNGKMQIAIDSGRDAFEVGKHAKDATLLRKQFVHEIRYITDMIDELRLVDTLYKQ